MNRRVRMRIVAVGTIGAWALLVWDALPWTEIADDGLRTLLCCVAASGSLVLAGWARSRPVSEIHEIAYQAGRRQGRIDATVSRNGEVIPFRSRMEAAE